MSNVKQDDSAWVADVDSIGKVAKTKAERREALDTCLDKFWSDENIGRIERVDKDRDHGWEMYRWQKG